MTPTPGPVAPPAWFVDAHAALPHPGDRDRGEETPWAMPIVLHIPKPQRPGRTPLLEASARAVVAACLNRRAASTSSDAVYCNGLRSWYGQRIRKIARRARGAQWERVQDLPGVTVVADGASARALVPVRVGEEPGIVAKLQIGGTDLPLDDSGAPPPGPGLPGAPTLWVDGDLGMTVGKAAAQVGHASMLLAAVLDAGAAWRWARGGFPLRVREVGRDELPDASAADVTVVDAGFTEIAPGSATVIVTGAGAI